MSLDLAGSGALAAVGDLLRMHAAWAAPILFAVMLLEGVVFTTFLLSGTLLALIAGGLIQAGFIGYPPVFAAIFLGFWVGDFINFELGRRGERWIRGLRAIEKRPDLVAKAENLIARHGWAAIFLSRFLGPTRPFVTLIAGACRMPSSAFHAATAASTALLVAGLLNAGMTGVDVWRQWK